MLHFAVAALAFTSPASMTSSDALSRRQAMGSLFGASVGVVGLFSATAAHAEMYGDGKAADKGQGAGARQPRRATPPVARPRRRLLRRRWRGWGCAHTAT